MAEGGMIEQNINLKGAEQREVEVVRAGRRFNKEETVKFMTDMLESGNNSLNYIPESYGSSIKKYKKAFHEKIEEFSDNKPARSLATKDDMGNEIIYKGSEKYVGDKTINELKEKLEAGKSLVVTENSYAFSDEAKKHLKGYNIIAKYLPETTGYEIVLEAPSDKR